MSLRIFIPCDAGAVEIAVDQDVEHGLVRLGVARAQIIDGYLRLRQHFRPARRMHNLAQTELRHDREDHRVDDTHRPHRHHDGLQNVLGGETGNRVPSR